MTNMPIAPIAYKEMMEHLEHGNFLALPDHLALPKEWRGNTVDLEVVQKIVHSAVSSLHAMPKAGPQAEAAAKDAVTQINLPGFNMDVADLDMIEDEETDCWEHAASLFEALSQAEFVNKK